MKRSNGDEWMIAIAGIFVILVCLLIWPFRAFFEWRKRKETTGDNANND